jgi:hypothetical protein
MKKYKYISDQEMRFSIESNDYFLEKGSEVELPSENDDS